jgi:hypothetical protein
MLKITNMVTVRNFSAVSGKFNAIGIISANYAQIRSQNCPFLLHPLWLKPVACFIVIHP